MNNKKRKLFDTIVDRKKNEFIFQRDCGMLGVGCWMLEAERQQM